MWAIFYADGTIVNDQECEPSLVPKTGVVAIAHMTPDGKRIQRGREFYWFTDDPDYSIYGGDLFGLWEKLTKSGSHIVLFGRSIPDSTFRDIVLAATQYKFLAHA